MFNKMKLLAVTIVVACVATPLFAAPIGSVTCSVRVGSQENNTVLAPYQKTFTFDQNGVFSDDLSTPIRQKNFTALTSRVAGQTVVEIKYFSDVSTFDAIGFSAKLTLEKVGVPGSTSGSNEFFTANGSFFTDHSLTCKQAK